MQGKHPSAWPNITFLEAEVYYMAKGLPCRNLHELPGMMHETRARHKTDVSSNYRKKKMKFPSKMESLIKIIDIVKLLQ